LRVFSADVGVVLGHFPEPIYQGEAETINRSSKKRYISIRRWILGCCVSFIIGVFIGIIPPMNIKRLRTPVKATGE